MHLYQYAVIPIFIAVFYNGILPCVRWNLLSLGFNPLFIVIGFLCYSNCLYTDVINVFTSFENFYYVTTETASVENSSILLSLSLQGFFLVLVSILLPSSGLSPAFHGLFENVETKTVPYPQDVVLSASCRRII